MTFVFHKYTKEIIELSIYSFSRIGTTPYEAHYKKKPERAWIKYINRNIIKEEPIIKDQEIHL
ncbi:MAG: hypothetical protein ACTS8R_10145, partial [Arsenophonus sp. NC-QC1-MAG3]